MVLKLKSKWIVIYYNIYIYMLAIIICNIYMLYRLMYYVYIYIYLPVANTTLRVVIFLFTPLSSL